ncbi:hypothetical protein AOQ84DRAFT_386318 [Glonium stellatum]|uniref:Heterokaryon incompatibility domain-containing protein n=1 Tax=Glonium stellatum TaxID=574774 RepID=A0A8E2JWW1_9PEZI|nr:hypothetical protein AOQ84DRAFT_386318 [Glonium stellatum]
MVGEESRAQAEYLLGYREAFEYAPLPSPTAMRLLKLESGTADAGEMVCCELVVVDLADGPVYDALSYTWGNPFPSGKAELESHYQRNTAICCNGRRILVKQNLYDALRRLRQPDITEERDTNEKTPLIRAAEEGSFARLYSLLSQGADVTSRDASGGTALHYAAGRGDIEAVQALVMAGSDVHALDTRGQKPIEYARSQRRNLFAQVIQFLDEHSEPEKPRNRRNSCLRNKVLSSEYVWIDALCINQADDAEKAMQVGIMGNIYKRAQSVVVWLGKERQDAQDATTRELLQTVWLLELATKNGKLDDDTMDVLLHDPAGYLSESIPRALRSVVTNWLSTFEEKKLEDWLRGVPYYKRRWFERAWIIQEVMMADEATVVCGQFVLPWNIFMLMSCVVETIRNRLKKGGLPGINRFGFDLAISRGETLLTSINQDDEIPAITLERKRRAFRRDGRLPFMSALSVGRNSSATDPRDHVFAVLSFSSPMQHTTTKGKEIVYANYINSTKQLFVTVGKCLMEAYGPSILSLTGDVKGSRVGGLPSWIPDLSTPMYFQPLGVHTSLSTEISTSKGNGIGYNAVGDSLRSQLIHISPTHCLVLKGIKWDVVVETAQPGLGRVGTGASGLIRWASLLNKLKGSATGRLDALWRTFISDEALGSHPAQDLRKEFTGWLKFISIVELSRYSPKLSKEFTRVTLPANHSRQNYLVVLRGIGYSLDSLGVPFSSEELEFFQKLYDGHSDWATWYCNFLSGAEAFGNIIRNKDTSRRLFRTKKNFIGTGPERTEVGDLIFIIPGTTVPYIIRNNMPKAIRRSVPLKLSSKIFGSHHLIGEAYVHGIMHGEGVGGVTDKLETLNIV